MIARFAMTWHDYDECDMKEHQHGDYVLYTDHVAETCKLRDKLLECAKQCDRCHGTGLVTIQYGGDGYGDKCCGLADADDQPCPECEDIREALC